MIVRAKMYFPIMSESCPTCDSETGLREIIYGLPAEPVDESKYAIGGCCPEPNAPIWTCVECGWKGWSLNNSLGTKLSEWKCPICEGVGKFELINLNARANYELRNSTFKAETTFNESLPNAMCLRCGWTTNLVRTYSY